MNKRTDLDDVEFELVSIGSGDPDLGELTDEEEFQDYDPWQPRDPGGESGGQWIKTNALSDEQLLERYLTKKSKEKEENHGGSPEEKHQAGYDEYKQLSNEWQSMSPDEKKDFIAKLRTEFAGVRGKTKFNLQEPATGPSAREDWKDLKEDPAWKDKERSAVGYYKGSGYQGINGALRDSKGQTNNERITAMDRVLQRNRLPTDKAFYRGLKDKSLAKGFDKMKPGDIVVDHGFTSVSTERKIAYSFGAGNNGVRMKVYAKKGARGLTLDKYYSGGNKPGIGNTYKDHEAETILHRGAKLMFRGIKRKKAKIYGSTKIPGFTQYEFDLVSK